MGFLGAGGLILCETVKVSVKFILNLPDAWPVLTRS